MLLLEVGVALWSWVGVAFTNYTLRRRHLFSFLVTVFEPRLIFLQYEVLWSGGTGYQKWWS